MRVEFFDPYPYRAIEPGLNALAAGTHRVNAAVAFVTRRGVAFLRQYLKAHPAGKARPVTS